MKIKNGSVNGASTNLLTLGSKSRLQVHGFTGAHCSPYPPGSMGSHDLPLKPEGTISEFIEENLAKRKALKANFVEGGSNIDAMFAHWKTMLGEKTAGPLTDLWEIQKDDPFFMQLRERLNLDIDVVFYPTSISPSEDEVVNPIMVMDLDTNVVDTLSIKLKDEYVFKGNLDDSGEPPKYHFVIDPANDSTKEQTGYQRVGGSLVEPEVRSILEQQNEILEERSEFLDGFRPESELK